MWRRYTTADFRLSVAFTAGDAAAPAFVSLVHRALHESALDPRILRLQIEPDDRADPTAVFDTIDDLRLLGVDVSATASPTRQRLIGALTAADFRQRLASERPTQPAPVRSQRYAAIP